jgi:hypothetical protein
MAQTLPLRRGRRVTGVRPFATFPDAEVGRSARARLGGGMSIAIKAAAARPRIVDAHGSIGNNAA